MDSIKEGRSYGSIPNFVKLAEEGRPDFETFRNAVIGYVRGNFRI